MKNSISRLVFAGVSVLLQVLWFLLLMLRLDQYFALISAFLNVAALVLAIWMLGRPTNAEIKTTWIVIILALPVFGVSLYLLFGRPGTSQRKKKAFDASGLKVRAAVPENGDALGRLAQEDRRMANQCRYLQDYSSYPVYSNSDVAYYSDTCEALEAQKEALRNAKHFIFLEYFAIEHAEAFEGVLEILMAKVAEGVKVRILYDDVGSIGFLNPSFVKSMEAQGIECRVFNPVVPILRMFMNHRDHRKIMIVDGEVGFTGGYNLANEYFNLVQPYGRWKDAGVRVRGDAVRNFTIMFLEMWNGIRQQDEDFSEFFPEVQYKAEENGYVQPYADSPLDRERVGENTYLNMIKSAQDYVYIMTPYLIISDDMGRELALAAKRGVDVRIIIPKIPDKKIVYRVTCSYLGDLTKCGVRVYKYTPGFCHSKVCLVDDRAAIVGTINFDYRSLFHHFEDACLFYRVRAVKDVRRDFEETFPECEEVTEIYCKRSTALRTWECVLRFIAPLL
jgi:cardiolipin synthase